eukprot:TRINITY_DN2151_c0_g1_i1.p1 TRINITY_DN2151_c0_g1~~TRINITY_DN2151_c0_g1_i1.p1  ORF type:complete len:521 (-),score=62.59 TRINITY_DN2151_c0_g1_i1:187-1749(-)
MKSLVVVVAIAFLCVVEAAVLVDNFRFPVPEHVVEYEWTTVITERQDSIWDVSSQLPETDTLGGSRVIEIGVNSAASRGDLTAVAGRFCEQCPHTFAYSVPANSDTRLRVIWDGSSASSTGTGHYALKPNGLGGVDLTANDENAFAFILDQTDISQDVNFRVYSSSTSISEITEIDLADIRDLDGKTLIIPFSVMQKAAGALTAANFESVGAIELEIVDTLDSNGQYSPVDLKIESLSTIRLCDPPCQNEGVCEARDTCNCAGTGFVGDFCEIPDMACMCLHGGTCPDPTDNMKCNCTGTGYTDAWCATPICSPTCSERAEELAFEPNYIDVPAKRDFDLEQCIDAPHFSDPNLKCVAPDTCACGYSPSPFTGYWTGYETGCSGRGAYWTLYVPPTAFAWSTLTSTSIVPPVSYTGELRWCGNDEGSNLIRFDIVKGPNNGTWSADGEDWLVWRGILQAHQTGAFQRLDVAINKMPNIARPRKIEASDRAYTFSLTKRAGRAAFVINDDGVLVIVPGADV